MTNEEIIAGMLKITDDRVDPAYLTQVIDHVASLDVEVLIDTFRAMRDGAIAAGDAGRLSLQRLNLAMAKDKKFCEAVTKLHSWKDAQALVNEEAK